MRAQIDMAGDLRRHGVYREQAACPVATNRDGAGADTLQKMPGQFIRDMLIWRGIEDQSGDLRGGDPVRQPHASVIRDGGHVDQDFDEGDEGDGHEEQPARQAEMSADPRPSLRCDGDR